MIYTLKNIKKEVAIIITITNAILIALVTAIIAAFIGYMARKKIAEGKINQAEIVAKEIVEKAEKDSETVKKEKLIEAKEEVHKMRNEFDRDYKERRSELQKFEKRLIQKEEH